MKKIFLLSQINFILLFGVTSLFGQETDSDKAQKHFDRGIAIVENAESPEDYNPAIKEFEESVRLAPDWPDAYYNLGMVQEVVGKFTEAILSFRSYLLLAPDADDADAVKSQINKLEYRAENVLTVADIIDVLVSFSNTELWEKVGEEGIRQPFEFIRRKDSNSVEFPLLYGLEWGPDERFYTSSIINGPLFIMRVHTFCDAWDKQAYCHYWCDNEIEIVSRTHVRIRQQVDDADISPITPPVKNGTYTCEYRKLEKGADINAKNKDGKTPLDIAVITMGHTLHEAAMLGQMEMAELLIVKGADINAKDNDGKTPLLMAANWSSESNSKMEMAEFLITKGADINAKDNDGRTPLSVAVDKGDMELAELLIDKGADINAKDKDRSTLLHMSVLWKPKEVVELLIAKGADINAKDNDGRTPLHMAVFFGGKKELAELLITKGADINAKDNDGKTPLQYAESNNLNDMIVLLKKYGGR